LKKETIQTNGQIEMAMSKYFYSKIFMDFIPPLLKCITRQMKEVTLLEFLCKIPINSILAEKSVLQKASHPFVVRLHYSFQSVSNLYFVMDFCAGGELFTHLKRKGKFLEETTLFYATEVILALEYLHDKLNIIYR